MFLIRLSTCVRACVRRQGSGPRRFRAKKGVCGVASEKEYCLDLSMAGSSQLVSARTVLAYESAYRGVSMGQAALRLLRSAVDEAAYPPEVRDQLREIRESMRRRAAERTSAVGGPSRGA